MVEEEVLAQAENPPAENNFYFDICGVDSEPPTTQGKPSCIYPFPCCFKLFITWDDALGDRSCVLNNCCIPFLGNWLPFLVTWFTWSFLLLNFALENKMFCFKQKVMLHKGWGFLQRKYLWWWIHHGRDGFNIWKDVPLLGTKLWDVNDEDETERVTCTRRMSRCSASVWVD